MNTNKIIKYIPKYTIIEKNITDKAILDDLIHGNKFTGISFSYKTETLIQFIYYCLTFFFKNKTYGESFYNIKLSENNTNTKEESYLFKLKLILPNLMKLVLKYLSYNNKWFNFTFQGLELIDLIFCFESGKSKSTVYDSLLDYLLNLKYRLENDKINQNIIYTSWFNIFINKITDIISDIISQNMNSLKSTKDKLYNFLGFGNIAEKCFCQICKQIPINAISFKCGHFYCYYCFYYNSKILFPIKEIKNICLICNDV